uniref:Uncharacterized protein n=1 Tax=Hanusia phi TaxID=3032 RepID=A0A7S0E2D8_9CRYP
MSGLATFSPSANAWMIPAQKFDPLATQRAPVHQEAPPSQSASRRLFHNRQGSGKLEDPNDLINKIRSAVDELQSSQLVVYGDQSADLEERKRLASTGMGVRKAPSQLESRRQTPSAELYDEDYQRVDNRPAQSRASSCRPPPPWNGEQPANVREVPPYVSRIDPYREAASSSASGYGDSHATDRHRQTSLTACMQECDTLMENLRVLKYEKLR